MTAEESAQMSTKWLDLDPRNPLAHLRHGNTPVLLRDDRYPSALGIMPESRDTWKAMCRLEDLALVLAMLGQQDEAIDRLDLPLSRTGEISAQVLRLDPRWESLKANPRFKTLLAKYAVKP